MIGNMRRTLQRSRVTSQPLVGNQLELDLGLPPNRAVSGQPKSITRARNSALAMVAEFHRAFGLPIQSRPTIDVPDDLAKLRVTLIREEFRELQTGIENDDIVAVADALGDLAYVIYGTALTYGIDLDLVVREIHNSNMTKLDKKGKPILRSDGKVLKPAHYRAPEIIGTLLDQGDIA